MKAVTKRLRCQGGGLTAEASIAVVAFVLMMSMLIGIIDFYRVSEQVDQSLFETAGSMIFAPTIEHESLDLIKSEGMALMEFKNELAEKGLDRSEGYAVAWPQEEGWRLQGFYNFRFPGGHEILIKRELMIWTIPATLKLGDVQEESVLITPKGECYHFEGCWSLSRSKVINSVSTEEAIENGYRPCKICMKGVNDYEREKSRNGRSAANLPR